MHMSGNDLLFFSRYEVSKALVGDEPELLVPRNNREEPAESLKQQMVQDFDVNIYSAKCHVCCTKLCFELQRCLQCTLDYLLHNLCVTVSVSVGTNLNRYFTHLSKLKALGDFCHNNALMII